MKRHPLIFLSLLALSCSSCAFLPSIGGDPSGDSSSGGASIDPGDGTTVTEEKFDQLFNHYGLLNLRQEQYGIEMSFDFGDFGWAYIFTDGLTIENGKLNRHYYYETHTGADDFSIRAKYRPNGDGTYTEYEIVDDMDGKQHLIKNEHWTPDALFDLDYLQIGLQYSMFEYTAGKEYVLKETYNTRAAFMGEETDLAVKSMYIEFENGMLKTAFGTMSTRKNRSITFNMFVLLNVESGWPPFEEPSVSYQTWHYGLEDIIALDERGGRMFVSTETATEVYGLHSSVDYIFFEDQTYQSVSYVLTKPVGQNRLEYVHGTTEKRNVDGKYAYTARPQYIKNQAEGYIEAPANKEIDIRFKDNHLYVPTDVTYDMGDDHYRVYYLLARRERYSGERISYFPFGNEEAPHPKEETDWTRREQFLVGRFDSPTLASQPEHLSANKLTQSMEGAFIEFYYLNRYFFNKSYNGYEYSTGDIYTNTWQNVGYVDQIGPGAIFTYVDGSSDQVDGNVYYSPGREVIDSSLVYVDDNTIEYTTEYSYGRDPETDRLVWEEVTWQFHRSV